MNVSYIFPIIKENSIPLIKSALDAVSHGNNDFCLSVATYNSDGSEHDREVIEIVGGRFTIFRRGTRDSPDVFIADIPFNGYKLYHYGKLKKNMAKLSLKNTDQKNHEITFIVIGESE